MVFWGSKFIFLDGKRRLAGSSDVAQHGLAGLPLKLPPRALGGERFESLYASHHDFVRRTAMSMGAPSHAADDVVQDVFLVALRRLDDFDDSRSPRAWLFGIVRNVARRARDKQRRSPLHLVPSEPTAPDEALDWQRAASFVEDFLETLDEDRRSVFVLCEIEGMTAPEVSFATGMKLNTVYSRLRVARDRFAKAVARKEARRHRGQA